jgi:type II secretory pathway pseudopilin PulG
MGKPNRRQQGFTLIASMLLLVLLSSVAIGLMFLANGSGHIGNNDLEANVAYYGAESGMEKLTTDLLTLYQSKLSPTQADLTALASSSAPSSALVGNMTYNESAVWTNPGAGGLPITSTSVIGHGPFAGLSAQMVPITLQVSAIRPSGAAVNMTRGVQVALIPVFQFGVFSDSDLSYFPGPKFSFKGRVHTNGNLFLAADSGPLILNANATAHGEIIRDRLANGFSNGSSYQGNVLVPTATRGCNNNTGSPSAYCQNVGMNDGSWTGGIPNAGYVNPRWKNVESNFAPFLTNQAPLLQLPFVQTTTNNSSSKDQIQIIKEPLNGELLTTPVGASREYNKADIRVLIADTAAELHPDGSTAPDANDVNLATFAGMAQATAGGDPGWPAPGTGLSGTWPLIPGFLRVEYLNAAGVWVPVTNEWLAQGFSRGWDGTTVGGTVNTVNPNAIFVFQKNPDAASTTKWFPLNMYDAREGFPRDISPLGDPSCYVNGIMNNVELNVGNLRRWVTGAIAGNGTLVDKSPQNGYLVYFADRRGQANILPKVGKYGFEDVVNSGSATGTPDGVLDASKSPSPEDVDQDGLLDVAGAINVGTGFGVATTGNPYQAVDCVAIGRPNAVTGARHGLKLVNGALNNLPMPGFTVVAENPVYVQGDYNSNSGDTVWNSNPVDVTHSAAAVIADSVTLLSVNWTDDQSMSKPNSLSPRTTARTNYRMAIASGKNINFPQPPSAAGKNDFGTDGGVHNFLRYLENWNGGLIYYRGSMVSLYYSEYSTGLFKCCSLVYTPPARNYSFDEDFLTPSNLPPGTPMLQDIENLTYWQNFAPCSAQSGSNCTN